MSNNNKKVFESLISRTKIYLVIIFVLLTVISYLNVKFIIPSLILFILILLYTYFTNNKRKNEINEHLQDLTLTIDSAAKRTLINSPFPLVILENDGNVIWKSTKFIAEFANININTYLNDLITEIDYDIEEKADKKDKSISKQIKIEKHTYKIVGQFAKSKNVDRKKNKKYMIILYFIDESANVKLEKEYTDSKSCVGIISIDNYEDIMQRIESDDKPQIIAEIEKTIYDWANETNGVIIKSDRDQFVYIFEQRYLEQIKEEKFKILNDIKEIDGHVRAGFTLSIAISNEGNTDKEKYKSALATMDVILGRGGDQAAIRENGKYQFFGGRTEEVEKRTKVKARIVAHALEELIKETKQVIIMGHTNPDIDSMGASLGVYRISKSLNKPAFVVNTSKTATSQNFVATLEAENDYKDVLINRDTALNLIDNDTLLVVVDTHKTNYVELPELLDKTNKVVIIDHHRRSTEFIEKSILTFQEVYASSASELVTELLQYSGQETKLSTLEAESLYAGIMVDTKNFTFKTGVRTFEAAAYLRKCGVDIIRVKKWFQSDLDSYNKIAEIVKDAEIINQSIGLAIYDKEEKDASLICAKAADELLTISNITASFVLGNDGNRILISGRSIGDINVQVILEKLGGGGHITLAGAQIEGKTMQEVKEELIEKINEYFSESIN